jgi:hypothetical protein
VGSGGVASLHLPGTPFRVLSRDGGPPADAERGPKDVVAVAPGERVRLLLQNAAVTTAGDGPAAGGPVAVPLLSGGGWGQPVRCAPATTDSGCGRAART